MIDMKKYINLKTLFWAIYIFLLFVMLPHTQRIAALIYNDWWTGLFFAVVFEASILGFSVEFKKQIEEASRFKPRKRKNVWGASDDVLETERQFWWRRVKHQYGNVYFSGLGISALLSGLANFTYSVEASEGLELATMTLYNITPFVYHFSFGLILPIVAFLFAFVLAERTSFDEVSESDILIDQLRQQNKKYLDEIGILKAQQGLKSKETALLHIIKNDVNKERRVSAAFMLFPNLNNSGAAILADCDPSYITNLKGQWGDRIPELEV